jgi:hypothetical protein
VKKLDDVTNDEKPFSKKDLILLNLEILLAKICNYSNELKKLKLKISDFNNKIILYSNLTLTDTLISGDSMYSSQIYSSMDTDIAIKNNFPIFNMTECELILKKYYKLPDNSKFIFVTSNINSTLTDNNVNAYQISIYDSVSKNKLDTNICKNTTQMISMPLSNIANYNISSFKYMKQQGVDIFNPDDPYYNDRCRSYANNTTGLDTTVNWRRQNTARKIPQCFGLNCTYEGVDDNNYVQCLCSGADTGSEIINKSVNFFLDSLSQFNIEIFTCFYVINVNIF